MQTVSRRLNALLGKLRDMLKSPNLLTHTYAREDVEGIYRAYVDIRGGIDSIDKSILKDVPCRELPRSFPFLGHESPGVPERYLQELRRDIEQVLSLLPVSDEVKVPSMKLDREGVFFAGQFFDALLKTAEILSGAKRRMSQS
jgi:hypothetical protein